MNWGIQMTDLPKMDTMLDDMFAQAGSDPAAQPSDDFMARMMQQAEDLQPSAPEIPVAIQPRRSFLRSVFETLGGWQGASGLAAATIASVWVGFSGADALTVDGLQSLIDGDTDYYLSDLGGDFSFEFEEG